MKERADAGFTLLELVVAMSIVSLAIVGIVEGVHSSVLAVAAARRQSQAAAALAGLWAEREQQGVVEGEDGGELASGQTWTLTAATVDETGALLRTEIGVSWSEGGETRRLAMVVLLPARVAE